MVSWSMKLQMLKGADVNIRKLFGPHSTDHGPHEGIVNLTPICQTGQHEKANTQLSTSPFSL